MTIRAIVIAATFSAWAVFAFAGNAHALLIDRGAGLIYDTEQNITWLQDTNLAGSGMIWTDALDWADQLVFAAHTDWRLPTSPATAQGFINEGEMGFLYYTELGNPAGGPLSNTGPFVNFPPLAVAIFWLDATPLHAGSAWNFEFGANGGFQNASSRDGNFWFAWTVHDGDVGAVNPEPSAAVLFGVGSLIVGATLRKRRFASVELD